MNQVIAGLIIVVVFGAISIAGLIATRPSRETPHDAVQRTAVVDVRPVAQPPLVLGGGDLPSVASAPEGRSTEGGSVALSSARTNGA